MHSQYPRAAKAAAVVVLVVVVVFFSCQGHLFCKKGRPLHGSARPLLGFSRNKIDSFETFMYQKKQLSLDIMNKPVTWQEKLCMAQPGPYKGSAKIKLTRLKLLCIKRSNIEWISE